MPRMAEIVEVHMEISWSEDQPIRKVEVVFLADKLVAEDRFVGIAERFNRRLNEFSLDFRTRDGARADSAPLVK